MFDLVFKIIFTRPAHLVGVAVPIYKSTLSEYETISFQRCLEIFEKYPITIIAPKGLTFENIDFSGAKVSFEFFNSSYFKDISSFSKLMLSVEFYKKFLKYKYILIYQLDAFVFKDELSYWCKKRFDYVGAPWFTRFDVLESSLLYKVLNRFHMRFKNQVGNGGFSLRHIKKFLFILLLFKKSAVRWPYNEDIFWAYFVKRCFPFFKTPDFKTALQFSFETYPEKCYELNNHQLPFGCHAWQKYNISFWRNFFVQLGYPI